MIKLYNVQFRNKTLNAAEYKSVAANALWHGALRWRVRHSSRSFTGYVVVAGFLSELEAFRFAQKWSILCNYKIAIRRYKGGIFGVSVPALPLQKGKKHNISGEMPEKKPPIVEWVMAA